MRKARDEGAPMWAAMRPALLPGHNPFKADELLNPQTYSGVYGGYTAVGWKRLIFAKRRQSTYTVERFTRVLPHRKAQLLLPVIYDRTTATQVYIFLRQKKLHTVPRARIGESPLVLLLYTWYSIQYQM